VPLVCPVISAAFLYGGSPLVMAGRLDAVSGFQITSRLLSILAVPSTV
jgi:hypothetical protein